MQEVDLRERSVNGDVMRGRRDTMKLKSPTLVNQRLQALGDEISVLRHRTYKLHLKIKMLQADAVEAENIDDEALFDPDEIKKCYKKMTEQEEVHEKEVMEYLFQECTAVGKRIKEQGSARGHRYSGLLIQFACMLRARCSADMYDFFRKVFNLPTNK